MFTPKDAKECLPRLRRFALRLARNRSDADDLTQHTLLRAWEHREKFRGGSAYSWTCEIMFNAYASQYRRRARFGGAPCGIADRAAPPRQEDALHIRQVSGWVARNLGPDFGAALAAETVGPGLTSMDSARMLGIPTNTLRVRAHRARRALEAAGMTGK